MVLYSGIRLPRTTLYLIFYIFFSGHGNQRNIYGSAFNAKKQNAATRTVRHPFKQHCTRGNSRLSLPVASQQRKLFATGR